LALNPFGALLPDRALQFFDNRDAGVKRAVG
jgi:hypothetical protein